MAKILIVYSTTDQHTLKICRHLRKGIEERGSHVTLAAIEDSSSKALQTFDKIVIGASIRYGKHSKLVTDFIRQNQHLLETRPSALFSVNLVARKPGRDQPDRNPYLKKLLRQFDWKPLHLAVFAGKINYPIYNLRDRLIIQLIMWITKGPTDPKTVKEFTDWDKVDTFGRLLSEM